MADYISKYTGIEIDAAITKINELDIALLPVSVVLTQAQYDSLPTKDPNVFYYIIEE